MPSLSDMGVETEVLEVEDRLEVVQDRLELEEGGEVEGREEVAVVVGSGTEEEEGMEGEGLVEGKEQEDVMVELQVVNDAAGRGGGGSEEATVEDTDEVVRCKAEESAADKDATLLMTGGSEVEVE